MTGFTVAVVGLGIGARHIEQWQALGHQFEVIAACDADEARLNEVCEASAVAGLTDFKDLLQLKPDIIDICTPPHLHFSMAKAALEAGCHVICEKPLVNSVAEVDELIAIANKNGKQMMPVSQYRFADDIQRLRYLVDQDLVGKPYVASVETHWRRDSQYYDAPWRGRWETERGGVLLGHALHIHDLLCFILGDVRDVFARTDTRVNAIETEDCASVSMAMQNGALVASSATLGARRQLSRLRFCFENVTAESTRLPYDPGQAPWRWHFIDEATETRVNEALAEFTPPPAGYAGQFSALYETLTGDVPLAITLQDARRGLELVTAMYDSSRSGLPVTLPITSSHPLYYDWRPGNP